MKRFFIGAGGRICRAFKKKYKKRELILVACLLGVSVILALLPTGFPEQEHYFSENVKVRVLSADNDGIYVTGAIKQGRQVCEIEILQGKYKGRVTSGVNLLNGRLETDKMFSPGDAAYAMINFGEENGELLGATLIDHYRMNYELLLVFLFAAALLVFSGYTGARTMLSFAVTLLSIWKVIVPLMLKGYPPLLVAMGMGTALTVIILLLIAGVNKRSLCAVLGAAGSGLITCLLALLFTGAFKITGSVLQWSEQLIYSGQYDLDLGAVFQAAVYLGCMGAIIDLSIDISASLDEVYNNNPVITRGGLVKSGFTIGRSVVGSQITALLFAYMGSYITVLMVYMATGTPLMNLFNSKPVAAEILHTFTGFLGLLIVAPLTSFICGLVYKGRKNTGAGKEADAETGEIGEIGAKKEC